MTNLTIIPHDGTLDGDSAFSTYVRFEYTLGMTLTDLQARYFKYMVDDGMIAREEVGDTFKVTGGWILTDEVLEDIDYLSVNLSFGNDSACYTANRMMKAFAARKAMSTIGDLAVD